MELVDLIGWVALVVTLVYTSLGLGGQVLSNHRRRTTEGLSLFMVCTLLATFVAWIGYGSVKQPIDFFIVVPNVLGAFCATGILYQIRRYRR